MRILSDLGILFHMLRGMPASGSTAERLQAFYGPQAEAYDDFRERLLHGRRELITELQLPAQARIVELGAGTGRNMIFFGERLDTIASLELVDLCPALLAEAEKKAEGKPQVHTVCADATTYQPDQPVDCVVFSYSLTMIPDWLAALDNACRMLKPGGQIAVVDFTLGEKQSALGRWFWRRWFGHDGVHLNDEHGRVLRKRFPQHVMAEQMASIPYLPGLRVPYYRFTGILDTTL